MGIFSFLKKEKEVKPPTELPPLPSDSALPEGLGDLPPIKAPDSDLPPTESPEGGLPPMPAPPEMPPEMEAAPEPPPEHEMPPAEDEHVDAPPEPAPEDPPEPIPDETMHEEAPALMPDVGLFPQRPITPQSRDIDVEGTQQPEVTESRGFPNRFVTPDDRPTVQEPEPLEDIDLERPLFVRADLYSDALMAVDDIKKNMREAEEILYRAKELRDGIGKEYQSWRDNMEDIQRKIVLIDQSLFE